MADARPLESVLDQTLPVDLQGVVTYTPPQNEEPDMSIPAASPAPLTAEQIKAIATEATKSIMSDANREAAIATTIEKLTTEKAAAQTSVAELGTKLSKAEASLATTSADLEKAKAELTAKNAELATATKQRDEAAKALADAQSQLAVIAQEKAVASRIAMVNKVELPEAAKAKLVERARAQADGKFTYSDETLGAMISDQVDAYAAGKASATPPPTGTPAPATEKPADGQQAQNKGTEQATAAATAAAAAAAGATPPAPSTDGSIARAIATANMMAGAKPAADGVKAYADMFPLPKN